MIIFQYRNPFPDQTLKGTLVASVSSSFVPHAHANSKAGPRIPPCSSNYLWCLSRQEQVLVVLEHRRGSDLESLCLLHLDRFGYARLTVILHSGNTQSLQRWKQQQNPLFTLMDRYHIVENFSSFHISHEFDVSQLDFPQKRKTVRIFLYQPSEKLSVPV